MNSRAIQHHFILVLIWLLGWAGESYASGLERIRISADGQSFVQGAAGRPFRVWGVNYDHDSRAPNGRLLEDYWIGKWETVCQDFREMKGLGANVVRVHLQLGKFVKGPSVLDSASLDQLGKLLHLAEETGLYLDITGLGCYHKADTPPWYDALEETARWKVQARFWSAVARTCRASPAVFCYDLMNEPVVGGDPAKGWVGGELGGKHFVLRLTLSQGKRSAVEVAKSWVDLLTGVIRSTDPDHLITVGVIPWAQVWPGAKPIFCAPEVRGALDFVSIHLYPKAGEVDQALTAMAVYDIGKPLVIEETFPLSCTSAEMDDFLKKSKGRAEGYLSFYWGRTVSDYAALTSEKMVAELMGGWLQYFKAQAEFMKQP